MNADFDNSELGRRRFIHHSWRRKYRAARSVYFAPKPTNFAKSRDNSGKVAAKIGPPTRPMPLASSIEFKLARMALHPENCEICERIAHIEAGTHAAFIAEGATGYAVMGDSQWFRGYCLYLCKTPVADLEELPRDARFRFLEEMALLSEAVSSVVGPHKMNVESLGNVVPHLHWHLFPRQLSEKSPFSPVWLVIPQDDEAENSQFDAARDGELLGKIRGEFLRLLNG